jgi:hypothetical protein
MNGNNNVGNPLRRSGRLWRAWLLGWICGVTVVATVYVLVR